MLYSHQYNPERHSWRIRAVAGDCRGVGDWEFVEPRRYSLEECIRYANNNWCLPTDDDGEEIRQNFDGATED